MRRMMLIALVSLALAALGSTAALGARNPAVNGPPSQSCQEIEPEGNGAPGGSARSPGSPFNEPEINTPEGGTGGAHYSEKSQYDVACYQQSQNH